MKKHVPLEAINAYASHNTLLEKNDTIVLSPVVSIHSNYVLNYDPKQGTLAVRKPDGTIMEVAGFNTVSTIGEGITGDTGIEGIDGADGAIGVNGEQGLPGLRGKVGMQGYQGLPGIRGQDGLQGRKGPIGHKGMIGPMNATGDDGKEGVQGERGYKGKDFFMSTAFSETEPEYPLSPGSVWYRIIARSYSGLNQETCDSSPKFPDVSVVRDLPTDSMSRDISSPTINVWRTTNIRPNSTLIKEAYTKYGDRCKFTMLNNKPALNIRNTLIALFVTEYTGGSAINDPVIDSYTGKKYFATGSELVWKPSISLPNRVVAFNTNCDVLTKTVILREDYTFVVVADDYIATNGEILRTIFLDRAGKCPGIIIGDNYSE